MAGAPLPGHADLLFRQLPASDVPQAAVLETKSYPADEAATPEKLEYRKRVAPELFYGVYDGSALIGFVVSTAAAGEALEEESMSVHVPGGESICIHSVVVEEARRRKGVARAMVRAYVDAVAADTARCGSARRMLLIAHAPLIGLYRQCGFELLGPSSVVHGSELWFDMRLDLAAARRLDFVQVDAFTPRALAGNPAAVLFTQRGGDEEWMQAVAVENNLSETAFLERRVHGADGPAAGGEAWDIRWFTPGGEVALCGHATLGSAHALWDTGRVPKSASIAFHTLKAGVLQCEAQGEWIRMDFPAQPPQPAAPDAPREALAAALGIAPTEVLYLGRGPAATPDWLLEVTPAAFARLSPDSGALSRIRPMERGVIVTCTGGADEASAAKRPKVLGVDNTAAFDFQSRFFAPVLGIEEDPVTGSAHCVLAPYWADRLGHASRTPMLALQASARGGVLRVCLHAGESGERVYIEGQAVTVLRGSMEP